MAQYTCPEKITEGLNLNKLHHSAALHYQYLTKRFKLFPTHWILKLKLEATKQTKWLSGYCSTYNNLPRASILSLPEPPPRSPPRPLDLSLSSQSPPLPPLTTKYIITYSQYNYITHSKFSLPKQNFQTSNWLPRNARKNWCIATITKYNKTDNAIRAIPFLLNPNILSEKQWKFIIHFFSSVWTRSQKRTGEEREWTKRYLLELRAKDAKEDPPLLLLLSMRTRAG